MTGVDQQAQMPSYYPCGRKTIWWYMNVWICILQMMMLNAHNSHSRYSGEKLSYRIGLSVVWHPLSFNITPKLDPND
jgi:hypothetical protein